jgi:arylsulfatase A-like enzyme
MQPNVLFFVIDSLRGDRLFGKNKNAKTPNIDFLMKQGAYFNNSVTTSDFTKPIVQSIFTAKNPVGCGDLSAGYYSKIIPEKLNLLNVLKDNNYQIYGLMEDALCLAGLNNGMENQKDAGYDSSLTLHNGLEKKIFQILDKIQAQQRPWFYYVHVEDLHRPCIVPEDFVNLTLSERYNFNLETVDSCIGKILEKIDLKNTLIIITGDHGEYLNPFDNYAGNQDNSSSIEKIVKSIIKLFIPNSYRTSVHVRKKNIVRKIRQTQIQLPHEKRLLQTRPGPDRMLFDDIIKVPLMFSGYGVKKHFIIDQQTRCIDIIPTIFDLFGLSYSQKVDGVSLKNLLEGKTMPNYPAYMESGVIQQYKVIPKPVIGIRTDNFKYFRSLTNPNNTVNLYDLQNDPFEDHNLAKTNPEKIRDFEQILSDLRNNQDSDDLSEEISSDEKKQLEEELKKLGYI